jgi:hypothetical protein
MLRMAVCVFTHAHLSIGTGDDSMFADDVQMAFTPFAPQFAQPPSGFSQRVNTSIYPDQPVVVL